MTQQQSRRDFLQTSGSLAAAATFGSYFFTSQSTSAAWKSPNERPVIGCIGTGSRWNGVMNSGFKYGDVAVVCDVDAGHAGKARDRVRKAQGSEREVAIEEDYRKVLERDDIDIVTVVTPDHWHTKPSIEAMRAGKDVYCEKPLTLTIDEGKKIIKVLNETERVFQVGTQQRTEMNRLFLKAIAIIRDGRIGDIQRVTCAIGGSPTSGSIPVVDPPKELNWEKWLGQAPLVDFRLAEGGGSRPQTRCHYEFRWWYEYSGGKMTDWGAHHIDIAQWAIEQNGQDQGPNSIEPIMAVHPVEFKDGMPMQDDRYNAATKFHVQAMFPNGVQMDIRDSADDLGFGNGIMFEGTKGKLFVNRGKLTGAAVEDLKDNPLPEDAIVKLYGSEPTTHFENFVNCVKSRELPISDVYSHHRAMTTCHLSNIAIRLNRKLQWDPKAEQIVGDEAANQWLSREQRKGYEIEA
ncbi:Gfo/Idh/MocA family oxidoreductase [Rubinisphaera sp. JC750]|uniref:Gfo/Idh/MocA family oxidoreductase n=1 Tax=Rubinisphaera sp. JC750 TaxID=2898658 RepID=UPI001F32863D|nr:Gfo/Idh/MocA family oxidoreductase [Rubinisphaera sp. JC750]